jgi:hypothetical protein
VSKVDEAYVAAFQAELKAHLKRNNVSWKTLDSEQRQEAMREVKAGFDSRLQSVERINTEANERFNTELEQLAQKKLPEGHIFKLGIPGDILQKTGFPAGQEIELAAKRLKEKSETERHPFSPSDIKGIAKAIQEPVAVFSYGDKNKAQNVIVELQKDDKNFLVGVHFNQERNGIFVSSIRGLYNKDNAEWLNWINQGKLLYADIEKLQAVTTQQRTNLADVSYLDLKSIDSLLEKNKNVKDYFTNPQNAGIEIGANVSHGNVSHGKEANQKPSKHKSNDGWELY